MPQLVDELILRPLGMSASGFYVDSADRLATPYIDGRPPRRLGFQPVRVALS